MSAPSNPPKAQKIDHNVTHHGHTRNDTYHWLKDENWQTVLQDPDVLKPEIRAYLEAENAYTEAALKDTEGLQAELFEEIRGRIKEDDSSVPMKDGPFAYYSRYATGGQHPIYARYGIEDETAFWEGPDQFEEQVLLNGDVEAEGLDFFRIGRASHSPDHTLFAYAVDTNGSEFYTLKVRDLATGTDLPDSVPMVSSSFVWTADSQHIVYVAQDENHRPKWVRLHTLGTSAEDDVTLYEEPDDGFFTSVGLSASNQYIIIQSNDHQTSEVRLLPSAVPEAAPILVAAREAGVEYEVDVHGEALFILTNAEGAVDFKIAQAPVSTPGRAHWSDLVPHEPGVYIRSIDLTEEHLVRLERVQGLPRLTVHGLKNGELGPAHEVAFDEAAYDLGIIPGLEFESSNLRFTYSSPTTPEQTYDYDMDDRSRILRKEQEVPSGHDASLYVTERMMAVSHDGAEVPVTILRRKDTPVDGTAPALLYGYGSYGYAQDMFFSVSRLSLVDRGFVYAIGHIRGGSDKGYGWYLDGKKFKKKNTFHDFIAAAELLVEKNYAAPSGVAIQGGSAGGMLVGAVVNMRPDLLAAVVAQVPFVDVLNTMLDTSLPLTPPEWPEWGNPIEDEEAYEYILSYSPYDNVEAKAYPPMLITGGLTDPRVTYWEPAKWTARLRDLKSDDNFLLLDINMEAGHAGAAGRWDRLKETAQAYAFLLKVFGKVDG